MSPRLGTKRPALVAGYLAALTLVGFVLVPGHTYLQADTQIFVPIFERIENPRLYSRDFLMSTAHVALTVYDEVSIGVRRVLGADWETSLGVEQLLFRWCGLLGVFLIATSCGLRDGPALLAAAAYGLGATIVGAAVLSVEYEPVARGFAFAMALLALGLLLHGRYTASCAAAVVGALFQPPATIPFWILFVAVVVVRERQWRALWPLAVGVVTLALAWWSQRGVSQGQEFFQLLDPEWEKIVRFRTAYDWIGQWPAGAVTTFLLYGAAALGAAWVLGRGGNGWNVEQKLVLVGLPLLGLASIPLSALLLDRWKWAILCQVQPARATLYTVVLAQVGCAVAAAKARRWWVSWLWLMPAVLPAVVQNPAAGAESWSWKALVTVASLAGLGAVGLWWWSDDSGEEKRHWTLVGMPALALTLAAGWMVPQFAGTVNYAKLHSPELDELSAWARSSTTEEALFLFANDGRSLEQGVFRAKSRRGLYVDWKSGGQVNYFRDFAIEWRKRLAEQLDGKLSVPDWRARGLDYLIYAGPPAERMDTAPVFANSRFRAYRLAH